MEREGLVEPFGLFEGRPCSAHVASQPMRTLTITIYIQPFWGNFTSLSREGTWQDTLAIQIILYFELRRKKQHNRQPGATSPQKRLSYYNTTKLDRLIKSTKSVTYQTPPPPPSISYKSLTFFKLPNPPLRS